MPPKAEVLRLAEQDRVEASPEQMARCSAEAERYSRSHGVLTRIIGWYHSHPHITVHASHVDIRTQVRISSCGALMLLRVEFPTCTVALWQANYQMMDSGFVGLIFSAFNEVSCLHTAQMRYVGRYEALKGPYTSPYVP